MPFRGQTRARAAMQSSAGYRSGRGNEASNWRTRSITEDAGEVDHLKTYAITEIKSPSYAEVTTEPVCLDVSVVDATVSLSSSEEETFACEMEGRIQSSTPYHENLDAVGARDLPKVVNTIQDQKASEAMSVHFKQEKTNAGTLKTVDTLSREAISDFVEKVCKAASSAGTSRSAYASLDYASAFLDFLIEGGTVTTLSEHLDSSDVQSVLEELERSDRFEGRPIAIGLADSELDTFPRLLFLLPSMYYAPSQTSQANLRHLRTLKGLLSARPFGERTATPSADILSPANNSTSDVPSSSPEPSHDHEPQAHQESYLGNVPEAISDWADCLRGHQMTPSLSSSSTFDSCTEASVMTSPSSAEVTDLGEQSDDTLTDHHHHVTIREDRVGLGLKLGLEETTRNTKAEFRQNKLQANLFGVRPPRSPLQRRQSSLSNSAKSDGTVTQDGYSQSQVPSTVISKWPVLTMSRPPVKSVPYYHNKLGGPKNNDRLTRSKQLGRPPQRSIPTFPPGVKISTGSTHSAKQCFKFLSVPEAMQFHKMHPPPCNRHYLLATGCSNPQCTYAHDYVLTESQLKQLRYDSKKSPCISLRSNVQCPSGPEKCHMGHVCPYGRNCNYGDRCKFLEFPGTHDGNPIAGAEERLEQWTRDSRRLNSCTGFNAFPAKHQRVYNSSISSPPTTPTNQLVQVQGPPPCPLAMSLQRDFSNGLVASPMTPPTHTWATLPFMQLPGPDHPQVAPSPYLPRPDLSMVPLAPMLYNPPMMPHKEHEESHISRGKKVGYLSPARVTDHIRDVTYSNPDTSIMRKEEGGLVPLPESTHKEQGAQLSAAS